MACNCGSSLFPDGSEPTVVDRTHTGIMNHYRLVGIE